MTLTVKSDGAAPGVASRVCAIPINRAPDIRPTSKGRPEASLSAVAMLTPGRPLTGDAACTAVSFKRHLLQAVQRSQDSYLARKPPCLGQVKTDGSERRDYCSA